MRDTVPDPTDTGTPSMRVPRRIEISIVVTFNPGDEDRERVVLDVDDLDLVERYRADGLTWPQAIAAVARIVR